MKTAATCQPILSLLQREIHFGPLINIDETTVKVLHEPNRAVSTKSYMWVCRGGAPDHPALLYHYAPSRSGKEARTLVAGYSSVVQTDGYAGYDYIDHSTEIQHGA
ncbi:IS66 family transposase [Desulfosediminicola flagellatus]|uniref:IS66 family transposase n=1 Tax=Desulfosediminicola flagellatus TaxID=2569541 RepID=UPI00142F1C1C|nr:transposase [Desulfosediminicola flagellatus]